MGPRLPFSPAFGSCGVNSASSHPQGTTASISAKNSSIDMKLQEGVPINPIAST